MDQLPDIISKLDPKYLQVLFQILVVLGVPALLIFANQLRRYGPDIRRLNKIETIAQLAFFATEQKKMTAAFGEATAASNAMRAAAEIALKDLESLKDYVTDMQEKMSEYNADRITQARLDLDQAELPKGTFYKKTPPAIPTISRTPDQIFESMRTEWTRFLDVFKQRLVEAGIDPKMNRIGKMTYVLSDRRRTNPLPVETADLITALHSQYRRHLAIKSISSQEHDNFVQLVKTAISELERKNPRSEQTSVRNGMSNGIQNTDGAMT